MKQKFFSLFSLSLLAIFFLSACGNNVAVVTQTNSSVRLPAKIKYQHGNPNGKMVCNQSTLYPGSVFNNNVTTPAGVAAYRLKVLNSNRSGVIFALQVKSPNGLISNVTTPRLGWDNIYIAVADRYGHYFASNAPEFVVLSWGPTQVKVASACSYMWKQVS